MTQIPPDLYMLMQNSGESLTDKGTTSTIDQSKIKLCINLNQKYH